MLRLQAMRGLKADLWEGGALKHQQIKVLRASSSGLETSRRHLEATVPAGLVSSWS